MADGKRSVNFVVAIYLIVETSFRIEEVELVVDDVVVVPVFNVPIIWILYLIVDMTVLQVEISVQSVV